MQIMSKLDKLIIKNSVSFNDDEINLLFEYLVSIKHDKLRSILTQDFFIIDQGMLSYPFESISISIVFDHLDPESFYFQASLLPKFIIRNGYADFNLDLNYFKDALYQDTERIILDEYRIIELNDASINLIYGVTSMHPHDGNVKITKLTTYQSFRSMLLGFIKLLYSVITLITPESNFTIMLNLSKINSFRQQHYINNRVLKSDKIPQSLQTILTRAEKTVYYPHNKTKSREFKHSRLTVMKAIDYSDNKKTKTPLTLKKVLANGK